jgi:hypothetical protein
VTLATLRWQAGQHFSQAPVTTDRRFLPFRMVRRKFLAGTHLTTQTQQTLHMLQLTPPLGRRDLFVQ